MPKTNPILLHDTRHVRDLSTEAEDLLLVAIATRAGRAAKALAPPSASPLQQTLVALCSGHRLPDHEPTGPSTVQVIRGVIRLTGCEGGELLSAGEWAPLPSGRSGIEALEDAVILLTVALDVDAPWSAATA
jgi:quercetin dioxygenase-like cupin family protein